MPGWLIVISALVLTVNKAQAQFGTPKGPEAQAVRSDIPFIRCEVCEHLAKQAYRQAGAFKKEASEKKLRHERKVKEIDLLEKIEKVANPLKNEGEWICYLDIIEQGDKLLLKEMEQEGKCGSKCKTIQKVAADIMESTDTDMAEKLWQGKMTRSQFTKWLCKDASSSCRRKAPPVPKERPKGPAFEVVDPEDAKMQRMMATMKEMGMGGQVFDRKQAQQLADGEEDDYDDDDEPSLPGGSSSSSEGSSPSEESDGIAANLQAGLEDVVGAAKGGLDAAKEAGKGLWSKAKNLVSGSSGGASSVSQEL